MKFAELNDGQWDFIKPHLPPQPIVERKRADDRKTINDILYVLITGCCWHDMPRCYGAYQTTWRRVKSLVEGRNLEPNFCLSSQGAYSIGKLNLEKSMISYR